MTPARCYNARVETIDRLANPPLARRLGDAVHVSPLLQDVCRMTGCPAGRAGEWLLKCAVRRGASHYERDFPADLPPDHPELGDEEIGVALCLGEHPYDPVLVRAAAQLLSSPQIDAARLTRLAILERVEPVLLYIAALAGRFAPETHPWPHVLRHLPQRLSAPPGVLPHWSRFVSQTGVTPYGGGPDIKWLCRSKRRA